MDFARRLAYPPDPSYARPPQKDPCEGPLNTNLIPLPQCMGPLALAIPPPIATPIREGGFTLYRRPHFLTPLHILEGTPFLWEANPKTKKTIGKESGNVDHGFRMCAAGKIRNPALLCFLYLLIFALFCGER